MLNSLLPQHTMDKVRAVPLSIDSEVEDEFFWKMFTVRSAYEILRDEDFVTVTQGSGVGFGIYLVLKK